MTNVAAEMPPTLPASTPSWREYRAMTGNAVVCPKIIQRMGRASFLARLVYNAAIDARTPFAEGFAYRLRLAEANRNGAAKPTPPVPSERFLPVPTTFGLGPELTSLCAAFPALREFPRSILNNALADACRARAAHVKACVKAKATGGKLPKLHFRRADDAWSITSDAFMLLRIGTDHSQTPPKRGDTPARRRNGRRRANDRTAREEAWATEKRRCGWNEEAVASGLERRKARQGRDRDWQQARQAWTKDEREERRVRRDSPDATLGARRMKVDVKGIGRFRIDLGSEIPDDAVQVRITLVKPSYRGAKVECRLVVTVPEAKRDLDPLKSGKLLHEVMQQLLPDATRLDAVEAARAAGLLVRGEDLGIGNPSCDDLGVKTPKVKWPRLDLQEMKRAQVSQAHKDRCRKMALPERQPAVTVAHDGTPVPVDRKARPRRSKACERERDVQVRLNGKAANRQATRAYQDAARLMRDGPILVATDPKRMVKPLLALGGPAERRARRLALESGVAATGVRPTQGMFTERRQRAMRRNMHGTRFSARIGRVALQAERSGTIHCTPGHEGTSSCCPACPRVRKKSLAERRHECPCGLSLPRDQASAVETLGRALLEFRTSADPGDRIATSIAERDEARAKILAKRARQAEKTRAAAKRRRTAGDDGRGSPRQPGRSVPVPGTPARKRVRGQGRNVRRDG